jgi:hypothetical protein
VESLKDTLLTVQRGEVAAEVAAGLYFEERRALVAALHRLLQVHVLPGSELTADVADTIIRFNHGLLSARTSGRSILVSRLIELVAVSFMLLGLAWAMLSMRHFIAVRH